MEINKRCKWCGSPFIAQKVSTQFCSHRCANASYKKKKRNAKLEKSLEEDAQLHPLELKGTMDKPYLSPLEVANYFGVSKATIYRYLANGLIKSLQLRRSTLIRKADIDALFDLAPVYKKRSYRKRENTSYYTIKEIIEKYKISKKAILRRCDKLSIPKIYEGRNVFFNKATIDTHFAELIEVFNVENYYTPSQLMEKYSLSKVAVLSFVSRHNIPRITRGRDVYYSKVHIDTIKHKMDDLDPEYYTFEEITEKYGISVNVIKRYLDNYTINTEKRGKFRMVSRIDFDLAFKQYQQGLEAKAPRIVVKPKKKKKTDVVPTPEGYYSAKEIAEKHKISVKHVWVLTREHNIPKIAIRGFNYYEQPPIDELFRRFDEFSYIKEWLTGEEVEKEYGMTPVGRRSFAYRNKIPTKIEHGITYYSKLHIDEAKGITFVGKDSYYSVQDIMDKYDITRDMVYYIIRSNDIAKIQRGRFTYLLKKDVDEVIQIRKSKNDLELMMINASKDDEN